jgi:cobalamin biosynthesis Co2+ chelatase CbiK
MKQRQVPDCIEPRYFDLSPENCTRVKDLLLRLQQSQTEDSSTPAPWIEALTNILFEALQYVGIIPGSTTEQIKAEVEDLKSMAVALQGIKNNLIDFRNLVN